MIINLNETEILQVSGGTAAQADCLAGVRSSIGIGTATGASIGGFIGSAVPFLGTAAGAFFGDAIGGLGAGAYSFSQNKSCYIASHMTQ